jgi:hypothetical protein
VHQIIKKVREVQPTTELASNSKTGKGSITDTLFAKYAKSLIPYVVVDKNNPKLNDANKSTMQNLRYIDIVSIIT